MSIQSEWKLRTARDNLRRFTLLALDLAPGQPPPVLPDVQLDFWANFYVENNFHARGILFETFLRAPREIAEAVIFGPAPAEGLRPLLPEQSALAERLLREVREEMFA